jgi:hypothetical protein
MASAGRIFRIVDGVRRAKVFELCGILTIPAEILNPDGTSGGIVNVPIDDLRSPRMEIDVSTARTASRFWRIHRLVQRGGAAGLVPILITPGSRGTLIKDIRLRN